MADEDVFDDFIRAVEESSEEEEEEAGPQMLRLDRVRSDDEEESDEEESYEGDSYEEESYEGESDGEESDEEESDEEEDPEQFLQRIKGGSTASTVKYLSFSNMDRESSSDDSGSDGSDREDSFQLNSRLISRKRRELEKNYTRGFSEVPWVETMVITVPVHHEGRVNPNDDLEREMSFLKQAVSGAEAARAQFEEQGIKYVRPDDYFAETLKTAHHMAKVRKDLADQKARLEFVEKRRREKEMKKYGKQVQAEQMQRKAKERKKELERVDKWRKEKRGNNADDDFPVELQSATELFEEARKKRMEKKPAAPKKSKKRLEKEKKYGYGGKRRFQNANTLESYSDVSGFNPSKMKKVDRDLRPLVNLGKRGRSESGPSRRGKRRKTKHKSH